MTSYAPHNDIIRKALDHAEEFPSQNISTPPYSASVQIAKDMLEDAVQLALDHFNGIYGLNRTTLVHVPNSNTDFVAWSFPTDIPNFNEINVQGIKGIYTLDFYNTQNRVDWHYRSFPDTTSPIPITYIITSTDYAPSADGSPGSHGPLYCDYVYFWTAPDGSQPSSSGYPRRFSDYAAILLGRFIARGLGKSAVANTLIALAQLELMGIISKFGSSQEEMCIPPGSIEQSIDE